MPTRYADTLSPISLVIPGTRGAEKKGLLGDCESRQTGRSSLLHTARAYTSHISGGSLRTAPCPPLVKIRVSPNWVKERTS
jgi:hypothetical protein